MHRASSQLRRHDGYVAIVLIALVCVAVAGWFTASLGSGAVRNERERKIATVLAHARQALLGRSKCNDRFIGSLA